ncbi:MAG: DNA-directed RNA polymerase [Candidatus Aenigmarchaeota archaeon]|nr:DNA-directed RNA polymerase [Candidatus Aenigmarchaeota archaeon]
MYKIISVDDKVRVSPSKFNMDFEKAVKSSLEDKWEGVINPDLGVILAVISIENIKEGRIFPGDGAIHYPVGFKLLTFIPENHELIKGNIIDVTEFGAFVNLGPLDGMIHVSQIMNDFVSFDEKKAVFVGRDSKRILKEGDQVMARIISVSYAGNQFKIGLTTRQAGLGALLWIDADKKAAKKAAAPVKKKE